MSLIGSLLADLRASGIRLWVADGRLKFEAPKGALTAELRSRLKQHKPEVMAVLQKAKSVTQKALAQIQPTSRDKPIPLSYAQQRLWFLDQLEGSNSVYNTPLSLRFMGPISIETMFAAIRRIVQRHEALRTTFQAIDGNAAQVISPEPRLAEGLIDLTGLASECAESMLGRLAQAQIGNPFDLSHGPLFRAVLVRLGEQDHALLVTLHHIISDGWSIGVLTRELTALYPHLLNHSGQLLPPLPIQYVDYAAWQRDWMAGDELDKQMDWWRQHLENAPTSLALPTDRPRPPIQTFNGAAHTFLMPVELLTSVNDLCKRTGATLYMVLTAVYGLLLARYGNVNDVLIGSPIAGRNRQELEPLIGFFINNLVLRCNTQDDPTFETYLDAVRTMTLGAFAHQDMPFEMLVAELQPERDRSRSPYYQVTLTLQNAPSGDLALPGLTLGSVTADHVVSKYDFALILEESMGRLVGVFEYNTDLFDETTIRNLAGHFTNLLQEAATDAQKTLSHLEMLTAEERDCLLTTWNDAARTYDRDRPLANLVFEMAARNPNAPALVYPPLNDPSGEPVIQTYAELTKRAHQLAHYLQSLGVMQETPVGLCVNRSAEMVVAMLAILEAGGYYVPLDPGYPRERLAHMLSDAGPAVLVAQAQTLDLLPSVELNFISTVSLDEDGDLYEMEPAEPLNVAVDPECPAYLVYTSGSTGVPKGVVVPHRAVNRLVANSNYLTIQPEDAVAQAANANFDAITFEVWGALLNGARVVGIPPKMTLEPSLCVAYLQEQQVSVMFTTTALFNSFVREIPDAFSSLRVLLFGGEQCDVGRIAEVLEHGKPADLLHVYGPTENTTFSTWHAVVDVADGRCPIGHVLANTTAFVADPYLRLCGVGVPGELYLGGDGLARGYFERRGLTAERFVPNPFNGSGERLYKTGDLVRRLQDGAIDFLGRVDHQIKLRGFRIELGEIETALAAAPGVADVIVILRNDDGNKRLVAYVVTDGAGDPNMRTFLSERLPDYMIPGAFVSMDQLPLNANGKVDRKRLPAPESGGSEETYVAPRSELEQRLVAIWTEILTLEKIGVHDDFFDIGGHSLMATQVISRLRDVFDLELPLQALFEAPTIAGLSVKLAEAVANRKSTRPPLKSAPRDSILPLSYAQQRMWFFQQIEGATATYNVPHFLRLHGALSISHLHRALDAIIERHESLRTTFPDVEGAPIQSIAEPSSFPLVVTDWCGLPGEALLPALAERLYLLPFDLIEGPLLRVHLVRLAENDHALLVNAHHIISDGWSIGIFTNELAAAYTGLVTHGAINLQPLAIQYADFAVWQRDWLEGGALEDQLTYWQEQLADLPSLHALATDFPRPPVFTYRGNVAPLDLDAALTTALHQACQRTGATLFMTLQAAFVAMLARYGTSDDIVLGTPIANRTQGELEPLIGFFVNTLVLRSDLSDNPSFDALVDQVRATSLAAYHHQDIPFEQLVETIQPVRSQSYTPLFQIMFSLQNAPQGALTLPGLTMGGVASKHHVAKFDLHLTLTEAGDVMTGGLEFNSDLFTQATAKRMLRHFEILLRAALAEPVVPVKQLSLLSEAERTRILEGFNKTRCDFPKEDLARRVADIAIANPKAVAAIAMDNAELSYQQLLARADAVAAMMYHRGIGPDEVVGICIPRSFGMLVAVLGIWRAGAAYLPLDPGWPQERLALMLDDADARAVLLTEDTADHLPICERIFLDQDGVLEENVHRDLPTVPVSADNLGYLIYTSGSTGRPKGVAVQRRVLSTLIDQMQLVTPNPGRVMQFMTLSFDVHFQEIFAAWVNGAPLVLIDEETRRDARLLLNRINDTKVERLHLPFVALQQLAEEAAETGHWPTSLRELISAGEQLRLTPALRTLLDHLPNCRMHNHYGPSETHACTMHTLREDEYELVPVGVPNANVTHYILDAFMEPVPPGVVGQLFIGGDMVGRGYRNRPALTAARFIPDLFGKPGSRLYTSGDLARYEPDGVIHFLGRADTQIKVRGFRIEPGEIESALDQHEAVSRTVVVAHALRPGVNQLIAYVQWARSEGPDGKMCRAYLAERLPEYMVPNRFVFMPDGFPLTPSGKVNRRALPDPGPAERESEGVGPRTPTEEMLAAIWREVLLLDGPVGMHDSFFELGGHSLLATRVVARIAKTFEVELPVRTLFEATTVAQLAAHIDHCRRETNNQVTAPIPVADRNGPLPLSFAQERLWFLDQMGAAGATQNLFFAMRLRGELNVAALEAAVGTVVARHEVLRTSFKTEGGEARLHVHPVEPLIFPKVDLSHLPEETQANELETLKQRESHQAFDLAVAAPIRCLLCTLGPEEHVFLLTQHHIITDGWSLGIFVREVTAAYAAHSRGQNPQLPELPVQYTDFASWQRQWLQGDELNRQTAYWRKRLAHLPTLTLPTDFPRPAQLTYHGDGVTTTLDRRLSDALHSLSRQHGCTLFMTLLAVFQLVLSRHAGQEDIAVGTPIAGRNRNSIQDLIGFFINTLVLRGDLSGDPVFTDLLRRTRESTLAAYDHQDLPFARLVEALQPKRDRGRNPLFQVYFNMLNLGQENVALSGLTMEMMGTVGFTTHFDLTLVVTESVAGLFLRLEFNTDLFAKDTARDLLKRYENLLRSVVATPQRRLSTLSMGHDPVIPAAPIKPDFAFTPLSEDLSQQSIPQRIRQVTLATPQATAVVGSSEYLTYEQLSNRAGHIATALREHCGQEPGRVVLLLNHDTAMVSALLGVLFAGHTYVPVDPLYPEDRQAFIIEDSLASVLLCDRANAQRAHGLSNLPVLVVEDLPTSNSGQLPQVDPNSPAYLLYTSGSTGKPKGVLQRHCGVTGHIRAYINGLQAGPTDRFSLLSTYGFDAAVMDLYGALLCGGQLHLYDLKRNGLNNLGKWLQDAGITIYHSTPTVYRYLTDHASRSADLSAIRYVILGGEEVVPEDVIRYRRTFANHCLLLNGLGPTESTLALQYTLDKATAITHRVVPIGRAPEHLDVRLLNVDGDEVDVLATGEIAVSGEAVACGYWHRADLTAEKFRPAVQGRMYLTGDLGRRLPDGNIVFAGRKDLQFKLRGYRIEPGEVESRLREHETVHDVVVALINDGLIAYVVAGDGVTARQLRRWAAEGLPDHLTPSAVVMLDRLPMNAHGKVDRRALPEPSRQDTLEQGAGMVPRTDTEKTVAAVWAEVLGRDTVYADSDFFELGGHSLLATRVGSQLREVLGVDLPLRTLFEAATVAQLAQAIDNATLAESVPAIQALDEATRQAGLPLSFAQQRLWFLFHMEGPSPTYNMPAGLELQGELDPRALQSALDHLVKRHESLRTTFPEINGEPRQQVHPAHTVTVHTLDLTAMDESAGDAEVRRLATKDALEPFDLKTGPLFRVTLIQRGPQRHVLLLTMHHIISDGWSQGVLVRELTMLYQSMPLPPLPIQYGDFAFWQRNWLKGEVLQRQMTYWRNTLADAPVMLDLPTDYQRPVVQRFEGGQIRFSLPPALVSHLHKLCRARGASLFMGLLAGLKVLLGRLSRSSDIVVGSPIANRNRAEIEPLIGFFVNTLALRTDLSGNPCFGRLLDRVRDTSMDAYAHQDLPFEKLVDELGLARHTGHTPLFQVLMVLQNTPVEGGAMDTVMVKPIEGDSVSAKTDLSFMMSEAEGGVSGRLIYNVDLFTADTAQRLAQHYVHLLTAAVEAPTQNVFSLPLMTHAETETLVHGWNQTTMSHQRGDSIPTRFAAVVAAQGQAEALVWGDPDAPQSMTYTQLNARATGIAYRLKALGLQPGDLVAVYLDRSMDVIPALLGITMAGGAYLPLDIAYPSERLALMLDDARPTVLITQPGLDALPQSDAALLLLDGTISNQTLPAAAIGGDAPAYVMYTSGSTGKPKGVVIPHRAVVDLVSGNDFLMTGGSVLQMAPVSFDAATFEIWGPLLNGGRCVLFPERVPTLESMRAVFTAFTIDTLWLTASLFNLIIDEDPEMLYGVNDLLAGGEALSPQHIKRAMALLPKTRIINGYGPTETTTFACCNPLPTNPDAIADTVPIGRPIANTHLYITDDCGEAVPVGFPGELLIGGTGLAWGYLNSPRLSALRFQPDPFSKQPGARLYRTGDLVRYRQDGEILFMGRFDDQVKLRGFRIELGEIESALSADPTVDQVKVLLRTDDTKRLVAYVVGADAQETNLRNTLAQNLPEYMVPSAFVMLDAMPLNPNGKIDTRRLPLPEAPANQNNVEPPRNHREMVLAAIWQHVLRVPRVGRHDNFFERGGDSILSIQVIARARQEGLSLSARDIFENQTLTALAAVAREDEGLVVDQGPVIGEHPLAPVQHWFLQADQPDAHHFNQSLMFAMEGDVDENALRQAGAALVDHHDALRLRFKDGKAHYAPTGQPAPLETWTLPAADETTWADAVSDAANQVQASLNLEHGPLLRLALFRPEPGGTVTRANLLLVIHHLAVDGVSWRILLEQLQTLLTAISKHQPVQLPTKTSAYRDWSARLHDMAWRSEVKECVHRWLDSLPHDWHPQNMPYAACDNLAGNTDRVTVRLNPRTTDALLRRVPRAFNTRIDEVLLTALLRAWRQWRGEQTLWLNLEGHGRDDLFNGELDLSQTVGWFTAVYPVLLSGGGTLESDLKTVKEHLRTMPLQGQGFGVLRYLTDDERVRRLPHPQVSFNYLGQTGGVVAEDGPLCAASESMGLTIAPTTRRAHLIDVSGIVVNDSLQLSFTYATGIHQETDIQDLAKATTTALDALIGFCTRKDVRGYTPSDFPLTTLNQETLDRLIGDRTDVADLYPLSPMQSGMLFHGLYHPDDTYFEQLALTFHGAFDTARFKQAWTQVVRRQAVLRTAFHWDGLETPLQLVAEDVALDWTETDWRNRMPQQQQQDLSAFLQADRSRAFNLSRAPLARWHVFRLSDAVQFVFSYHHLLLDGWSMPLLMREVFACYEKSAELPPAPAYRDYIAWISSHKPEAAAQYWREALSDVAEATPLPLHATVDDTLPAGWDDHLTHLSEEVSSALKSRARELRTTPNILGQAAWGLLLQHTTGCDDVVFGTTVSGRPAAQTHTIGLFINTLPVRVSGVGGDDWLQALHAEQVRRDEFSWCPLVEVQGYSGMPGGINLFDTLFVFENYPVETVAEEGGPTHITLSQVESFGHTNFPLTLIVAPGAQMSLKLIYDTRAYTGKQAEQLSAIMKRLLIGIAKGEPVLNGNLLDEDQKQVLAQFNQTDKDYGVWRPLHHAFEAQTQRTPQAPALVFGDETLTYRQLDQRANQLARHLQGCGVRPDVPVGVCLHRSTEMVVALYAVLKAGGAYLPLDPDHPVERLNSILVDADASLVLTTGDMHAKLNNATTIEVKQHLAETMARPRVALYPENLAYLIYTSGSTGKPKGVMNSHRAITNRLHWMQDAYRLDAADAVLQKTPFGFDVSVWEFFWPLRHGARLVIAEPGRHGDPVYLASLMQMHRITTLHFVPSMLAAFLEEPTVSDCRPRQIFASGEALPPALVQRFFQILPDTALYNLYGPTEAAVDVTQQTCLPHMQRVPIGKPVANTRLYVLDTWLHRAPPAVPGELFIGGVQPARGYRNQPALTAAAFLPDPFGESGARMYRTGDRAVLHGDCLHYLGRIDFQVKLRGFRIELGEIETALAESGAPRNVVLVCGDRLTAYIAGDAADEETLRQALQARLPEYMVPTFLFLSELPVTANGKLDRRALPQPGVSPASTAPPETETEAVLAQIWCDVLGLESVGRHGHFFRLGGHSLTATRLISQIREQLAVELPLKTIFDAPTPASMARAVEEGDGVLLPPVRRFALAERHLPDHLPQDGADYYPLSFAQQRLWFLDRLDPDNAGYNMPVALRLTGALDHDALEDALNRVIQRQGSLRTTFPAFEDVPVQRVAPFKRVNLPVERVDRAEAGNRAAAEAAKPFNLAQGPLLRVKLLQLADDEHHLLITQHHIISDGWSQGIFSAELTKAYGQGQGRGEVSPMPVGYGDYAVWQRRTLTGAVLQRQLDWWTQHLAHAPTVITLPTDRPRPALRSYRGGRVAFQLTDELTAKLDALAAEHEVTRYMLLQATFALLLSRYGAGRDVLVGSPVANRDRAEIEPLIGFFVNTLVMRHQLHGNPRFSHFLSQTREQVLATFAHGQLPFEQLVEAVQPERGRNYHPLFQVVFNLQETQSNTKVQAGSLTLAPLHDTNTTTRFDLSMTLRSSSTSLSGDLTFDCDLFDEGTAQRLTQAYHYLLTQVAAHPNRRLSRLNLVDETLLRQRLAAWNNTVEARPQGQTLHGLFAAAAAANAGNTAVEDAREQVTYAALDAQVNGWAEALMQVGVKPGDRVAVAVDRARDMITAQLATLKAGAAFVPLQLDQPEARLSAILAEADARVLLQRGAAQAFPKYEGTRLDMAQPPVPTDRAPAVLVDDQLPAYLIYTSGSTGRPKGVAVPHRAIVNRLLWSQRVWPMSGTDALVPMCGFGFDPSVWELHGTLMDGARLISPDKPFRGDTGQLLDHITHHQLTVLHFVPTLLDTFLAEPAVRERAKNLRLIFCGGEALGDDLARRCTRMLPAALVNIYGPTEAAISVTEWRARQRGERVTLGNPVDNSQLYLVDRWGHLTVPGASGEICIGGTCLAMGYHQRPARTAQSFVPNPFSSEAGARMYRTGDLGHFLMQEDGSIGELVYLGRADGQVKIRGQRIELGEIEAAMRNLPDVQRVAVHLHQGYVIAWVVVQNKAKPNTWRSELAGVLPSSMIPQRFITVDTLPMTPNGKLDLRALKHLADAQPEAATETTMPSDPLETQLHTIWQEELNTSMGVSTNFFEAGGHSLAAVKLTARIRRELGVDLPLATLFEAPTIRGMASLLRQGDMQQSPLVPIRADGEGAPFFCVHPGGGNVLCYHDLAASLQVPFYGLQSPGLYGDDQPETIEAMAARYLAVVKTVQPQGPYRLGGWSMGASVAYEMACQLRASGEKVAILAILDGHMQAADKPVKPLDEDTLFVNLLDEVSRDQKVDLPVDRNHLLKLSVEERPAYVAACLEEAGLLTDGLDAAQITRIWTVFRANMRARVAYRPQSYKGKITYFRSEEDYGSEDPVRVWLDQAESGLVLHQVPGSHDTMIEQPHVATLARILNKKFRERR